MSHRLDYLHRQVTARTGFTAVQPGGSGPVEVGGCGAGCPSKYGPPTPEMIVAAQTGPQVGAGSMPSAMRAPAVSARDVMPMPPVMLSKFKKTTVRIEDPTPVNPGAFGEYLITPMFPFRPTRLVLSHAAALTLDVQRVTTGLYYARQFAGRGGNPLPGTDFIGLKGRGALTGLDWANVSLPIGLTVFNKSSSPVSLVGSYFEGDTLADSGRIDAGRGVPLSRRPAY